MKKVLLAITAFLMTFNAYAEGLDVIMTTSREQITCSILEVTDDAVRYTRADRPAEIVYSTKKTDLLWIAYRNGTREVYVQEDTRVQTTTVTSTSHQDVRKEEITPIYIRREGETYYYDGQPMKDEVYMDFLQKNCLAAYNQYRSGYTSVVAGWTLLSCGIGFELGSVICIAALGGGGSTIAFASAGAVFSLVSIPCLAVGYHKMHKSADVYNTSCAMKKVQTYWSVNANADGLGLALHF